MSKTAIQELLEQIVLKQVDGSVYLVPAITDIQIKEALAKEREQIEEAYVRGHFDHEHVLKNDGLDQTSAEYYEEMYGNKKKENK